MIGFAIVKEIEKLIKIVGKGNLLEALFICMGSFQHDGARDDCSIDRRNHLGISIFAKKSREEHLDHYLNLKFSLQGLLLIYNKAYVLLSKDRELSVKEVIDEIYKVIKKSELKKDLGEMADDKKLDTFNTLINPRGEKVLKTEKDFEDQIIKDVKDVLETSNIKDPDLYNKVIDYYYSIHQINVNKNITLLFSSAKMFQHLFSTENDQTVSIDLYSCMYFYVLAGMLSVIEPGKNGLAVHGLNDFHIGSTRSTFPNLFYLDSNRSILPPYYHCKCVENFYIDPSYRTHYKNMPYNIPKELLKNQDKFEFEKIVNRNAYCVTRQETKHMEYRNTVCKLILGMFVLSVGLYVADYFLMEQKLFNSMKNILPQTNLIIAAVLTIVVVYALFQLLKSPQEPPLSTVDDVQNKKLEPLHAKQA
ncbi:MAG: WD1261 family protein [Wolbachia sp.]